MNLDKVVITIVMDPGAVTMEHMKKPLQMGLEMWFD